MVRTYVVTGDPVYKQHYQEILDIRDGRKPRPAAYPYVYWDLVLADDLRPPPAGPTVPFLELVRQAGFTEEEFASLADAKANSDALTRTEFAAMKLIESAGQPAGASRAAAIDMLHDAAYHQAKASIMRPIDDFHRLADQRTLAVVQDARAHATRMRVIFILLGLLLVSLLWRAQRNLHAILGGSVDGPVQPHRRAWQREAFARHPGRQRQGKQRAGLVVANADQPGPDRHAAQAGGSGSCRAHEGAQ